MRDRRLGRLVLSLLLLFAGLWAGLQMGLPEWVMVFFVFVFFVAFLRLCEVLEPTWTNIIGLPVLILTKVLAVWWLCRLLGGGSDLLPCLMVVVLPPDPVKMLKWWGRRTAKAESVAS